MGNKPGDQARRTVRPKGGVGELMPTAQLLASISASHSTIEPGRLNRSRGFRLSLRTPEPAKRIEHTDALAQLARPPGGDGVDLALDIQHDDIAGIVEKNRDQQVTPLARAGGGDSEIAPSPA